jgi:hypothetical protein
MSLLLPVLLLGLAQAADQPQTALPAPAKAQTAVVHGSAFLNRPKFALSAPTLVDNSSNLSPDGQRFDRMEIPANSNDGPPVCLTMRSYYFERSDSLAPEFVGMTTCETSRSTTKRVNRQKARLVPAAER